MRPLFQMLVVLVGGAVFFVTAGLALDYTIFGYAYLTIIPLTIVYMYYNALKRAEIKDRYPCCGQRHWDLLIANLAIYPIIMSLCWPMVVVIDLGGVIESRIWKRREVIFAEYIEGYSDNP